MNAQRPHVSSPAEAQQSCYFFLSYAYVPRPLDESPDDLVRFPRPAEPTVGVFFDELCAAVTDRADPRSGLEIGFFNQSMPSGLDIKDSLAAVLGSAEVFVPLCSPDYLSSSWPQRERKAFRERLRAVTDDVERHILPVLWTPVEDWQSDSDVERAVRASGGGPEYVENGLRVLRKLGRYRPMYDRMLAWLAETIVDVAERHPAGPSVVPHLDQISVVAGQASEPKAAGFLVATFAPDDRPAHDDLWWRSYAEPIAARAATVAERLGLPSQVVDIDEAESLFGGAPGIVLVDPRIAVGAERESALARIHSLPRWVMPVILESPADQLNPDGVAIEEAAIAIQNTVKGRARRVDSEAEFDRVLPSVVARARRAHLREVHVTDGSGGRPPRLRDSVDVSSEEES